MPLSLQDVRLFLNGLIFRQGIFECLACYRERILKWSAKLIKPTKINLCQQARVQNQVVYPYVQ